MLDIILEKLKKIFSSRLIYLTLLATVLFAVLIIRVYDMQVLETSAQGESGAGTIVTNSSYKTNQYRFTDSTRGRIFDRNGNILADNMESYNIVMGNSALLTTNQEKNEMISQLIKIIEKNNKKLELDFAIEIEDGHFVFNIKDMALLRFKKNAFGLKSVSDLTPEQIAASAGEVYAFLKNGDKASRMFGISDEYSTEETLKIMAVRYALFTLNPQYAQFTVCTNVDKKTIAAIEENSASLLGVEIKQVSTRKYYDTLYFSHIVGYTGSMSEEETEDLNDSEEFEEPVYNTSDQIGKTGIEKELDKILRGQKGKVNLSLTGSGKVISTETISNPVAGSDIYLTLDRELQIALYHILENNIAAILRSKIVNSFSYGGKGKSASQITIPIYEVYNAFFDNSVIDFKHFSESDATALEKKVYGLYLNKKSSVFNLIRKILDYNNPIRNNELGDESLEYVSFIYSLLKNEGVIRKELINEKDTEYIRYTENKISLCEFIKYAIDNQWVDLSSINVGDDYNTNKETYEKILNKIFISLNHNDDFDKILYRMLVFNLTLTGKDVCLLLYDQGIIEYNANDYSKLSNGNISAYNFVLNKLETLEITPGMLALEPCSGSIVITDVKTGDVIAIVTYPGYDSNRLANKIDWDYYQKLINNKATPLLDRPAMQVTATGSTFKPLMALAGLGEGIITTQTKINDKGIFELVDPSPKCWKYPGNHGSLNLTQAIQHSCNYFFYEVGYEMSLDQSGLYSDSLGISKIQKYASLFGLADKSGIEVPESLPSISSTDAVRTSIGYYHAFAPIQISRYVTAVANKGTVFNLSLVDRIEDKEKNTIEDNHAEVYNQIDIYSDSEWNAVQKGMYNVVNTSANSLNNLYGDLGFEVAGKTGTAQVSLTHPSHALFISFAPYDDPQISVTVVIPNGYASANAAKLAREVYGLYFNDENKEALLSGDLTTTSVTNIVVSD
jgi:penicillin-binding protein 2